MDTSLVYYTDNQLEPFLFAKCQEKLLEAAQGKRIISVSQKPLDFGDNICVGDIGRSHESLFTQALTGAKAATTKYVALAEHDCLYSPEHFNWVPPTDDLFYYNVNHWLVVWGSKQTGLYSYYRRKVLSQLICNRRLFIAAVEERLVILKQGAQIRKGLPGACEPGVCSNRDAFVGITGKDLGKVPGNYKAKAFTTKIPNLDIRHGQNFSGGRIAKKKCYSLPYWGSFHSVMGVVPPGDWYQEATVQGVQMPVRRTNDTNEKRWHKFIKPLVESPVIGRVTDLGCNAGFYCRKFSDLGFKATGVERDPEALRHNYWWEEHEPKGIRVVESDINDYSPTCSDYVLLANVHYWLTPAQLQQLVQKLNNRTLNVILIGRYNTAPVHKSPADLRFLRKLFDGWQEKRVIEGAKHFSVLFRNPTLTSRSVDDLFTKQQFFRNSRFLPSYSRLIDDILEGKSGNHQDSDYYEYLLWRGFKNSAELLPRHIDLVRSMQEEGIREPLTIGRMVNGKYEPNRLVDGDHRLIVAKKLGINSVVCKQITR
jgi:SAM-dependent methyltransferase